jgi:hypothetical protein
LELSLRTLRNSGQDALAELDGHHDQHRDDASTISASCQLISSMKKAAVVMFMMPQVTSSRPQVTSSAMRSESEVTRDMIQPTGVRS